MKVTMPKTAGAILTKLSAAEYEVYITGGVIHDLFLGRPAYDWDFTTSAVPEDILRIFPDGFYNNRFGTVGVTDESLPEKPIFDITTFRTESGYNDRRHPEHVTWGSSLKEDVIRRDFTINAMALKPLSRMKQSKDKHMPITEEWEMELIDVVGGRNDLEAKIIRTVGDPDERFREDALRMMRAIRIASQLQFTIAPETMLSVTANAALIMEISWERIRDELLKILATDYPSEGILLLRNAGLLAHILPELDRAFGVEQKSPERHHLYDVGTHLIQSLKFAPTADPLIRLATLLHDIGKPPTFKKNAKTGLITFYNHELVGTNMARVVADRLRLSRDQRELIIKLIRWHQFTVDEHQTDSAIRRFIRNIGPENIDAMLALRVGDRLGGGARETSWRTEIFKKRLIEVQRVPFRVQDLQINGYDVMRELAVPQGPAIGKILTALFTEVDEEKLPNEREALLTRMRAIGKKLN
jgi:tRNA nucleotidyltransferase (CCA-adding enzyme)